jgi:hypothetical protein
MSPDVNLDLGRKHGCSRNGVFRLVDNTPVIALDSDGPFVPPLRRLILNAPKSAIAD